MKDQENTQKGSALHNITEQALEVVSAIGLCLLAFLTGLTAALVLEVITK